MPMSSYRFISLLCRLLQIKAIIIFISYLFGKIEVRDPERRKQIQKERNQICSKGMQKKKKNYIYEMLAHAMKNDNLLFTSGKERKKIP